MVGLTPAARIVAAAIAVATIAGCGLSLSVTLLAVRLDAAGFSAHAIGINTAGGGIASLVGAPFIPPLARRLGVAPVLMLALVLGGAAMLGFLLSTDYGVWLALRFAVGLSVTALFVLSEFWIGASAPAGARGLAIGLYATSLGVGFAVGPALLAALGTAGTLPFFVGAALFWGAILPLAFNMSGAPPLERHGRKPFWVFLREAPTATLAGLLHGAIEVSAIGLLPVYAVRAGLGVSQGALFASLFLLGNSGLQIPLGLLSDRVDRHKLLFAITLTSLAGALALAVLGVSSLVVFEGLLLLWGGAVGGLYPVGLAQLGARYRDADLAGANAAFVMTYSLGMLIGPPIMGTGLDLAPAGFFLAIAGLVALYGLVLAGHLFSRKPGILGGESPAP